MVCSKFSSPLAILWLAFCLSSAHAICNQASNFTRICVRLRSFYLHEQIIAKETQVGLRLAVELLHLLGMFHIIINYVQWYTLARCIRQHTYSMFTCFSAKSELKGLNPRQNLRSPSFLAVQMVEALTICIST